MKKQKVLVTGGAGFIGSNISDLLISNNYEVVILDNFSTGKKENVNPHVKVHYGDVKTISREVLEEENPEYVIHNAAQINVRSSIEDPLRDALENIIGSISLLEACKNKKIKKFVFASSGGTIYGNKQTLPVKETASLKPLSPYGIAKSTIEQYLKFYNATFGLEYVALRYANVYGPRQNPEGEAGIISVFLNQILTDKRPCIWGDGKQTRDFVYVGDVARANLLALDYSGTQKVFNIGTGKETSINNLYTIVKEITKYDLTAKHNPDYVESIPKTALDCTLAKNLLNWEPLTSLEQGIRKMLNNLRKMPK